MVSQGMQMDDSDIISFLKEYGFKDIEISKILKNLPSKDFESIVSYVEGLKTEQDNLKAANNEKQLEEIQRRNELQKLEAERNERHRRLLKEKIAANRLEQQKKEEQELKILEKEETAIFVDAEIRVRVFIENYSEFYLGFHRKATIKDLFEEIVSEIGTQNFKIHRFGHEDVIPISNKFIFEEFNAKSIILEVVKQ